jgi:hypothetical protein
VKFCFSKGKNSQEDGKFTENNFGNVKKRETFGELNKIINSVEVGVK